MCECVSVLVCVSVCMFYVSVFTKASDVKLLHNPPFDDPVGTNNKSDRS